LWVGSCGVYLLDEICATPLSRQTTKCWSTQRGLAYQQACEPREKNRVILVIGFLSVIGCHHIVIGSFPTRRYNHPTHSITFMQTSCSKIFSVARFKSLLGSLVLSSGAL
jgi:hypothetical protein